MNELSSLCLMIMIFNEKMISISTVATHRNMRFCNAFLVKIIDKRATYSANSGMNYPGLSASSVEILWDHLNICFQFTFETDIIMESHLRTSRG